MSGMGYKVKDAWHHWTYTSTAGYADQVAGYATNYDVSSLGNVRIVCSGTIVAYFSLSRFVCCMSTLYAAGSCCCLHV
jgi:hypothetical protein